MKTKLKLLKGMMLILPLFISSVSIASKSKINICEENKTAYVQKMCGDLAKATGKSASHAAYNLFVTSFTDYYIAGIKNFNDLYLQALVNSNLASTEIATLSGNSVLAQSLVVVNEQLVNMQQEGENVREDLGSKLDELDGYGADRVTVAAAIKEELRAQFRIAEEIEGSISDGYGMASQGGDDSFFGDDGSGFYFSPAEVIDEENSYGGQSHYSEFHDTATGESSGTTEHFGINGTIREKTVVVNDVTGRETQKTTVEYDPSGNPQRQLIERGNTTYECNGEGTSCRCVSGCDEPGSSEPVEPACPESNPNCEAVTPTNTNDPNANANANANENANANANSNTNGNTNTNANANENTNRNGNSNANGSANSGGSGECDDRVENGCGGDPFAMCQMFGVGCDDLNGPEDDGAAGGGECDDRAGDDCDNGVVSAVAGGFVGNLADGPCDPRNPNSNCFNADEVVELTREIAEGIACREAGCNGPDQEQVDGEADVNSVIEAQLGGIPAMRINMGSSVVNMDLGNVIKAFPGAVGGVVQNQVDGVNQPEANVEPEVEEDDVN